MSRIDEACGYARLKMRVFPVRWNPGGEGHKAPMPGYAWRVTATSKINEVVEDFDRATQLWGEDNVMIAWACGEDGFMAVDLDTGDEPDWIQAFDWAAAENRTAKGRHLVTLFPEAFEPGNGTSNFPTKGWGEVRGKGGYIIIAGPDRPGFDGSQLERCKPFPRPEWLTPYGGPVDAVSRDEVIHFAELHNSSSNPNMIHGVTEACSIFERDWETNGKPSRHMFALWAMTEVAKESLAGYYPFKDGLIIVRTMWNRMVDPARQKREWADIVGWAVGKALADHHPPTDQANEDESLAFDDDGITLVNWHEFFTKERTDPEWLVEGLWPFGRHISIGSRAGQGKSELIQYVVSCLALGIDPWTRAARTPMRVIYLDLEMTEEDLFDRMTDFGYGVEHAAALQENLLYAVLPIMPALNSQAGLGYVERLVQRYEPDVFIIDTFMKSLTGDENDAATVQEFTRLTGMYLKARQIMSGRADHYGKDPDKGNRGTSAKDDDVDVAWRLVRPQGSYTSKLTAMKRRQGFVPERLAIERYHTAERGVFFVPADQVLGNVPTSDEHDLIAVMDLLEIPIGWGRDRIRRRMIEAGYEPGDTTALAEAIRIRKVKTGSTRDEAG